MTVNSHRGVGTDCGYNGDIRFQAPNKGMVPYSQHNNVPFVQSFHVQQLLIVLSLPWAQNLCELCELSRDWLHGKPHKIMHNVMCISGRYAKRGGMQRTIHHSHSEFRCPARNWRTTTGWKKRGHAGRLVIVGPLAVHTRFTSELITIISTGVV